MWRAPGKKQKERLGRSGMITQILLGVASLSDGIVPFPKQSFIRISVVIGMVIIVSAFLSLPIFKSLPPFWWNKTRTAITVQMPFANVSSIITCRAQDLGHGNCI